jgi:hypothetical protein
LDEGGASPVPVQMWQGRARYRRRCGRGEPSPGADVTADVVHTCLVCTDASALACTRSPCAGSGRHARQTQRVRLARLCRDWAHPCHICTGTGLGTATSAPGLGAPQPHEVRDWGSPLPTSAPGLWPTTAYHICAGTGLTADHISIGTGLTPPTFAPRLCAVQARSSYSQLGYSHLGHSHLGHSHLGHSYLETSRGAGPPMFGSHQSQRRP